MGAPGIEEIKEQIKDWEYLNNLPERIGKFTLDRNNEIDGLVLNLASYRHDETKCRLDLIYTSETFDYLPVKNFGLQQFRDIRYIYRSRDKFEESMRDRLAELLDEIEVEMQHDLGFIVREAGIQKWDYSEKLPQKIGRFELYIKPSHAMEYINGSVILIDYSDFATGDQLLVLYNRFRDEYFAETKQALKPGNTTAFDARNLADLEKVLSEKLENFLLNF